MRVSYQTATQNGAAAHAGNRYGFRYSYVSSLSAAGLPTNRSAFESQVSNDRVRWAMLPMRAAVVHRWPYSTSHDGAFGDFTQSRKSRAWSASLIGPSAFFAAIIGFAPVRQPFSMLRSTGVRAANSFGVTTSGTTSYPLSRT